MKEILLALALSLSLTACDTASDASAKPVNVPQPADWKAVLIAGDDHEPAFDNAVDAMAETLVRFGVARPDISILKATARDNHAATQANIGRAFADLRPAPTDGCFVFVTSHGGEGRGLYLARGNDFISPNALAGMLSGACGNRPTVVVASGCFSGTFAQGRVMPAANRTILTAARADRPSFGCNAGLRYTVFDQCILDSMERGIRWLDLMGRTRQCVSARERTMGELPSSPQLSVGASAAGLTVFGQ
ncbi:MAG TPA: C13 family peptidase [Stellaceae bacterium]|nr:C13 family peptidase [Stellaceae bacterium]